MIRTLAIPLVLAASPAAAGCYHYTENPPAPRVVVCFDQRCEMTTIDFACSNVYGAQSGFANGWRIDFSIAGREHTVTLPDGSVHDAEGRFICLPVDRDSVDGLLEGCG